MEGCLWQGDSDKKTGGSLEEVFRALFRQLERIHEKTSKQQQKSRVQGSYIKPSEGSKQVSCTRKY